MEDNEKHQRSHHKQNRHTHPFESCWHCSRQRAVCRSKKRFATIEEAYETIDEVNYLSRDRLLIPYICRWGTDLHFHNRTAKTASGRRHARKRMSKLLR